MSRLEREDELVRRAMRKTTRKVSIRQSINIYPIRKGRVSRENLLAEAIQYLTNK